MPIFATAPATSKMKLASKVVKIISLLIMFKIRETHIVINEREVWHKSNCSVCLKSSNTNWLSSDKYLVSVDLTVDSNCLKMKQPLSIAKLIFFLIHLRVVLAQDGNHFKIFRIKIGFIFRDFRFYLRFANNYVIKRMKTNFCEGFRKAELFIRFS